MLEHCADQMELLSEHFYCQEQPGLLGHVRQIPEPGAAQGGSPSTVPTTSSNRCAGKKIRIALDEWNYWYGPHEFGELGTRYFLKDALGIAAGLHEMARQSDMFYMANYAQTVNVIGCIKTSKTDAAFATTGLVLKLYRKQFGEIPITTDLVPAGRCSGGVDGRPQTFDVGRRPSRLGVTRRPADDPRREADRKRHALADRWSGSNGLQRTGPAAACADRTSTGPAVERDGDAATLQRDAVGSGRGIAAAPT